MTYRTPESLIRSILSGGKPLNESVTSDHMNPALKLSDEERLSKAVEVLKANGVGSAAIKDNAVSITAGEANIAADVLDRALMHGSIDIKPMLVSAEALPMPEPHVPGPEFAKEEKVEEINQGEVDEDGNVKLQPRSLVNRKENQLKKIDENVTDLSEELPDDDIITLVNLATRPVTSGEIALVQGLEANESFNARIEKLAEAGHFTASEGFFAKNSPLVESTQTEEVQPIEELSTETLKKVANVARKKGRTDVVKAAIKAHQRNRAQPDYKFAGEEVEPIAELDYKTLVAYTKKGVEQIGKGDPLDQRIARRKKGIEAARAQKASKVSKAAFGESINPMNTVIRVRARMLSEGGSLRLVATHNSECGKHQAKVYKDHEWSEHRVKFFIHGKHHEPGDYHTTDVEDAHDTARHELKRLTKLNGALKEAADLGEDLEWLNEEMEQVDELSKALLHRYLDKNRDGWDQRVYDRDAKGKKWTKKLAATHEKRYNGEDLAVDKLNGKAKVNATNGK